MSKKNVILLTSAKGGVGKSTFLLNFVGLLSKRNKKILIIDCDLISGSISLSLNLNCKKTIFNISDDMFSNRFKDYKSYITSYNNNIDIIQTIIDPRDLVKIDINYIIDYINIVKEYYDYVFIDTDNGFTPNNIKLIDNSDTVYYIMNNDLIDIKCTKSYFDVINDLNIKKYKLILNNSKDINHNYFSNYEIKKAINKNIDYSISKSLYIKNITSFLVDGEIFTLNKSLTFKEKNDLLKIEKIIDDLIES